MNYLNYAGEDTVKIIQMQIILINIHVLFGLCSQINVSIVMRRAAFFLIYRITASKGRRAANKKASTREALSKCVQE